MIYARVGYVATKLLQSPLCRMWDAQAQSGQTCSPLQLPAAVHFLRAVHARSQCVPHLNLREPVAPVGWRRGTKLQTAALMRVALYGRAIDKERVVRANAYDGRVAVTQLTGLTNKTRGISLRVLWGAHG